MKYSIYLSLLLILLSNNSCINDEQCRKDRYIRMTFGIYHVTSNKSTNTNTKVALVVDSITVRGLTAEGKYIDSVSYKNLKKVSLLKLPLNKEVVESKFVVLFNNSIDTITILHQNKVEFLSLECGCLKVHSIDTVIATTKIKNPNSFIDSVKIVNHNVNTTNAEHLQIYN